MQHERFLPDPCFPCRNKAGAWLGTATQGHWKTFSPACPLPRGREHPVGRSELRQAGVCV